MVKKLLANSYLYIVLALLYLPILFIIVFSFSPTQNFNFGGGISFDAYKDIFFSEKTPLLMNALKNTVFIGVISAVIATIFGTFASIGIFNLRKRVKRVVSNVNQLPIINSEIVVAVSLMVFFVSFKFPEGYLRLILGHISFCTPYVILSIMPRLESMDKNIYEAALDLGASPTKAMTKVMIPLLAPGILSGFVMSLTLSMDDFIITQINKGASTGIDTLSTYIYSDARIKGLEPFWFAIFSIIFVLVLAVLLYINLRNSKKKANPNPIGGK